MFVTAVLMLSSLAAAAPARAAGRGNQGGNSQGERGLPAHVFAPYFETYDTASGLAALSQRSAPATCR